MNSSLYLGYVLWGSSYRYLRFWPMEGCLTLVTDTDHDFYLRYISSSPSLCVSTEKAYCNPLLLNALLHTPEHYHLRSAKEVFSSNTCQLNQLTLIGSDISNAKIRVFYLLFSSRQRSQCCASRFLTIALVFWEPRFDYHIICRKSVQRSKVRLWIAPSISSDDLVLCGTVNNRRTNWRLKCSRSIMWSSFMRRASTLENGICSIIKFTTNKRHTKHWTSHYSIEAKRQAPYSTTSIKTDMFAVFFSILYNASCDWTCQGDQLLPSKESRLIQYPWI